ncbi:MAG: PstS family phosphate ABC transporter substrate-binding protein [Candidatus Tectomicrobia bacterium]|uniref:Phosphate-binding protein n=1 Tax=Tectimicrobiota bacterium TaxID=2528274 RepID=A0A932CS26_UNCTE|nr:PstS family phosphate ABC transporter substrate-binding protein [Candidatus Tectomicrobia bacterium]
MLSKTCRIMLLGWLGLCLGVLSGCGGKEPGRATASNAIQVKGSDTEVNLVQRLAEEFMKAHPQASISVTGGGSGTGIAALIDQRADLANSSREMKPEEVQQARQRGVNPVHIVFAVDGLAIIAHPSNPLESLSLEDLAKIFRGEVTNWKEVGGPDLGISLYGRQSNSGTFIYFRDTVLKGDYAPSMKMMNGSAQIVEGVPRDRAGIGYVGVGYVMEQGKAAKGAKVLRLAREKGGEAISPLEADKVEQGIYPLSRPLYQYINGTPKGALLEFLQFELSPEGQRLVAQEGFFSVPSTYQAANRKVIGG